MLGSAAGCHPGKEDIPVPRKKILGSDYRDPHLHPRPEHPRRHSSPEETSLLDTSRAAPQDSLIFLAGLGVGWTDRQTETFGCRLFGYWWKATRNENAFAVIKIGP